MATQLVTFDDGGNVTLNLHAGQSKIWTSEARVTAMIAGTQGGKTSFGPWWLYREIYGGWGRDGHGAGDYLAVSASYDLFKLKMLPELRQVLERWMNVARYWSGDKIMELKDPATGEFWASRSDDPMWGRIILRSASAEGGLESATAGAAWLDEAGQDEFPLSAWDAINRRLSLAQGRILITTTPYNLGWLKQQVFDRWQKGDPTYNVVQFASTENPLFPQEELERRREEMPGWKFRMFYLGQFERPAGMIYSDFVDAPRERGGHKVEPFGFPPEFVHYVGVDPGAVNTATVWLAHDTVHDVYYVYRATLEGGKSTREHVTDARAYASQHGYNVVLWGVGAKPETQQRMDWQEAGVPAIEPPFHDVESGIDKVIGLLRQHRLFFFDDQHGLLDEIATYSRELDENGEPLAKIKDKERYHRLDALRYAVASTRAVYEDAGELSVAEPYRFGGGRY